MNKRSKILAGSSIFAFLAVGGSGAALGLAYSGELFTLFPALSSIGISTIGPILIAAAALFATVSLILSISFLRSRHLEKKKSKEGLAEEYVLIDTEEISIEQQRIKYFNIENKKKYFEKAIKNLNELAIATIISEEDKFEGVISTLKCGHILCYAAKEGGDKAVKCVKSLGANINKPSLANCSRYSPIYYAITLNDPKALKILLDNGADPTKMHMLLGGVLQEVKNTPLMEAVVRMQTENVRLLLNIKEVKDKINAVDLDKDTALMCALASYDESLESEEKQEQYGIVKLLLDKGANPTIENSKKQTALSLARENNCGERVISLLEEAEKKWKEKGKGSNLLSRILNYQGSQGRQK